MAEQNSVAKQQQAPAPDDSRKPDTPTEVHKPAWGYVLKRSLAEFSQDKCTTLAAALTYYAVLAIFPALLALVSLVGLFGQAKQTSDLLLQIIGNFADASVVDTLRGPVEALATSNSAGLALVIGVVAAIWSASGYVSAFSQAMNQIYEVDEGRPFWKLRPTVLLITVILLVLAVVVVLLLLISGPIAEAIGQALGLGETVVTVWNIAKWPVIVVIAVLMIAIIYYGSPNVKQPRFKWISLGAVIALVVMAIASLLFFFYVSNFGNYQKTYGSIAGVIVLLLWLWIANLSLLFGAEFDAELERGRELQGGIEAAETLQLPPRDDRQTKKRQAKEEKLVEAGRELREDSGDSGSGAQDHGSSDDASSKSPRHRGSGDGGS
ncbi:YihY/virulence factor BrkB family protein [Cryobacterium tepidiphilum]|uniref:YihY/virulence factor BrkB family protein n=1 Tax=Cryobacterium tepidiphilum TaxID=2486026 RepID=A0A3M8LM32_9MICO|nr:YihY/virulence factor BrkB family protein [Cryobacterium tepidiphilum]RNE66587.1 YihY/virulence factor BrkB family protein [Cryobacterium tepidiphilum]